MAWYDNFLGGLGFGGMDSDPSEPYEKAAEQFKKAYEQSRQIEQPFINAAGGQRGILTGAENELLNPSDLLNKWIGSYQESPYAKQLFGSAQQSGLDAAASQGLLGSSAAINNIQTSGANIMNADRQQYLNDLMNKYLSGIGIGQNIYGYGANAANTLAGGALNNGQNLAGTAYGAAQAPYNRWNQLLGTGIQAAGAFGGF